ncbi:hypothetical protein UFOVP616_18 [uncultured Caudovirales phage]|uniref:Uncharacterized protein n=1 Tax=uncultured Caudovirales phage TaxID=2100421 RepID=A0A6J5N3E1_9CAUD|nr:hypothetical protein UFOVP616_18 [uncultured Caudovirales phage]
MALLGASSTALDIQTVTTGVSGTAPNRIVGWRLSGPVGAINDATSNIYAGAAITALYWSENGGTFPFYILTITGATNTGWTTLNIGGQDFLRTSATFGTSSWSWSTFDTITTQSFGVASTPVTCTFT